MTKFAIALWILFGLAFLTSIQAQTSAKPVSDENFRNPLKLAPGINCSAENIDSARFDISYAGDAYSLADKVAICQGIDAFIEHSRKAEVLADQGLRARMQALWDVFLNFQVRIIPLPVKLENSMFIASAAYPRNVRADRYQAAVYIPVKRVSNDLFFYAFWHELQHVCDLESAWENYRRITNYELEFNGFYMASLLAEVYQPKSWMTGQPAFWDEAWKSLSPVEQNHLRTKAIDQYIYNTSALRDAWDKKRADYDFSRKTN